MTEILNIKDLHANAGDKEILKGLNLKINAGEVHVIMGPNGAGKSTLANVIFNNPIYKKTSGEIDFIGENINNLKTNEIANKGIFMSFQLPEEVPGITLMNFLKAAHSAKTQEPVKVFAFKRQIEENMNKLNMNKNYASRDLNVGFSGGEKKKNEILQMSILEPKLAILDETDSGLDRDATKIVFEGIKTLKSTDRSMLIITHYDKVLEYLEPDFFHILIDGKIVKSGGKELAEFIEENGYEKLRETLLGE